MQTVTLDFETFYDREYSLSKITTEEYIRDDRFESIGFAIQIEDGRPAWFTGNHDYLAARLEGLDWDNTALLGQNTAFDAAILSWRFDIHPRVLLDTMSMARPIVGPTQSVSLANLARYFELGEKGDEVVHAIGKRRADFTREELARYGEYCRNDVALTYKLYTKMLALGFPMEELKLIDLTLKMFTEPTLQLNPGKLAAHLTALRLEKRDLLVSCMKSAGRKDLAALVAMDDEAGKVQAQKLLRSDAQFAELLEGLGVTAPTKISPKTGKVGYAFAKTDAAFKEIVEHEDPAVQALAAARLGTKTTIEESRTERFMGIAERGSFPVPLKYYAAHSGRWGGCLVADTEVIVYHETTGVVTKRIVDVLLDDLVWDGEDFVSHDGVAFSGYAEVIEWDGVLGTKDHVVYTDQGGLPLEEAKRRAVRIAPADSPDGYEVDIGIGAEPS